MEVLFISITKSNDSKFALVYLNRAVLRFSDIKGLAVLMTRFND